MKEQTLIAVRPRLILMLLISLLQGIALFLLWRAATNEVWPSQTPVVNFPLWTIAAALPLLLLLGLEDRALPKTTAIVGLFCLTLALLAAYIGWQATPIGAFPVGSIIAAYILPLILGCFLALLFLRPLVLGRAPDYAEIFSDSWRNALVAALSAALALGVTGVLMLWGELFRVIGIDFFIDLFTEDWFLFPVLSVVVGLGIFIFRGLANVIGGITGLLQGLMWLLLPLVLTVSVLFIGALPFTGLEPLWDTGNGTALLMALNLLSLFALNAVYQQGDREPYPLLLHRLLCLGIVLLPVIAVLALYGLYLRVDQYGWTVARCWALLISLLITLFSFGYAGSVARFREEWTGKLAHVNLPMSQLMLILILLLNSPLLDFRKISLASQQGRAERGEIALEDFDFFDARENMGRPAYLWMQDIVEENRESNPDLAQLALEPARPAMFTLDSSQRFDFRGWVTYRPEPFAFPDALADAMQTSVVAGFVRSEQPENLYLFQADLDADDSLEYVLAGDFPGAFVASGFRLEDGEWRELRLAPRQLVADPGQALAEGLIEVVEPEYFDLQIGDIILQVLDQ